MLKKTLIVILFIISANVVFAQTYLISAGGTVTTCAGDFYDSGGDIGTYSSDEDYMMTFCSDNAVNTHVRLYFWEFSIEPSDTLYIYNGPDDTSPLIGAYNNTNSLSLHAVIATAANPSGCLTAKFQSNSTSNTDGWKAEIACIPCCQQVIANISPTTNPPAVYDPNDHCSYIDICQGDDITFVGTGDYPENDIIYHQEDGTSTFDWDFGDGTIETGQTINHHYDLVRGYDVTLTVTDVNGCVSTNFIALRVRISSSPLGNINPLPDICSGTNLDINVGYDPNSNIVVNPIGSHQSASQGFDSIMFVPDGPYCPEQCYNTDVEFNAFAPGQTITSVDDILSICVNMEHSWVGDLEFTIICPNGQSVVLKEYIQSGGAFMGEPNENDGSNCDPSDNPPGIGWNYCWSEIYPTIGTINDHASQSTLDSTNTINNTGYYDPHAGFSGLIGCPLNGVWSIEICDYWGIDNGYIFSWDLNLDPNLLPTGWGYDIPIDQIDWDGPFITDQQDSIITVSPDYGGIFDYTVYLTDAFGCSYDTTISLNVVQSPVVDLGNDTSICGNGVIILDAGPNPGGTYLWSTGDVIQTISIDSTGIYSVVAENTNGNLTCSDGDTVSFVINPDPEVNFIAKPATGCEPLFLKFYDMSSVETGTIVSWDWDFGDGNTSITNNPFNLYELNGNYDVSLTVTTDAGCSQSLTIPQMIHVYKNPVAAFSINPSTTTIYNPGIFFSSSSIDADSCFWNFGDGSFANNCGNVFHQYQDTGSYLVTLDVYENGFGCHDSTSRTVIIGPAFTFYIPNAFTPNFDGFNETFYGRGTNIAKYEMKIFDRWGSMIFKTTDLEKGWDGKTDKDIEIKEGLYIYLIKITDSFNRKHTYRGRVTLVK